MRQPSLRYAATGGSPSPITALDRGHSATDVPRERKIARSRTMSEHAKGNALDISRIELNSGRDIEIEKQGIFAFRSRSLLNNVRSDACEYFSTVLGPGYNYDHRNHFHFDIKPRRRVSCH